MVLILCGVVVALLINGAARVTGRDRESPDRLTLRSLWKRRQDSAHLGGKGSPCRLLAGSDVGLLRQGWVVDVNADVNATRPRYP